MTRGAVPVRDAGAAVVEFVMVITMLLVLLFGALQVAAVFYVRSVTGAAAADGARLAASAGGGADRGAARANELIARGLGQGMAGRIRCDGGEGRLGASGEADGAAGSQVYGGVVTSWVRCRGSIRSVFLPVGGLAGISVTGEAVRETQPAS
jgi:hypothetical protein